MRAGWVPCRIRLTTINRLGRNRDGPNEVPWGRLGQVPGPARRRDGRPGGHGSEAGSTVQHLVGDQRLIALCVAPATAGLAELQSSADGISADEAHRRLASHGRNELAHRQQRRFWAELVQRLTSPLVVLLVVIATVSAAIGQWSSTVMVGIMVLLSVGLSNILDLRSSRAVDDLIKRVQPCALVLRDGAEVEVATAEVVPGDVVVLRAGAVVAADVRLVAAHDFFVSESTLTGESMPVEKTSADAPEGTSVALGLGNACFMGTSVTSGTALGLVVNTGMNTVFGAITERLLQVREQTAFDRGLTAYTWLMIRFITVLVAAVFLIVGLTKGDWMQALLFGLSVAVGLTPEMLPTIVTVNLAKGALDMAKKKVIVRRLPSIQNFGAITILCTDKTGTLTQDRVILADHLDVLGRDSDEVMTLAYLNSALQTGLHNVIDRAIIDHPHPEVAEYRLVDELPFDFERRRMSVVVDNNNDRMLICKGAVEEIYSCCTRYLSEGASVLLDDATRSSLRVEAETLNRDGYRVLGVAYRQVPADQAKFTVLDETDLVLAGYLAFRDPPKPDATEALTQLAQAGVAVKVLTGDNALVARKVCQEVGLAITGLVTGEELAKLSTSELSRAVDEANVFVKVSPAQKEQIITILRGQGHVVGFMGDGINDAPALRAADVGISVDSAVDVAKDCADIVLLEKSLLVLKDGIVEGRRVFANIVKYLRMGASSNFGNMFSVVGASFLLPFLPMQPVQILTNNLLYDFSQTSIPTDRVDDEFTTRPLAWNITNVRRFMVLIGPISSLFDYATFALMWFSFGCSGYLDPAATPAHREYLASLFQTGWFVESLLTQTLIVHIIRTRRIPFLQSRASINMILTTLTIIVIGGWLPYSPYAPALKLVPLPGLYWVWIAGFLVAYATLTHLVKTWFFDRYGVE